MPVGLIFALFVATLIIAAILFLRPAARGPVERLEELREHALESKPDRLR